MTLIYFREQAFLSKTFKLYLPILHYLWMLVRLKNIVVHGNLLAVLIIQKHYTRSGEPIYYYADHNWAPNIEW